MQKPIAAAAIASAVIATLFAAPAQAQNFVNILTGATTGVYFPLGNALSGIYAKALPETKVTVQSTKASVENLNLIQAGRGEVAFTLGDALSDAWKGNEEAGYKTKLDKLRVMAPLYSNYIQIVVSAESGIQSIDDLKGTRLSVGPAKSGTELNARSVLAAAGLSYADLGKIEYLPFGQSVELMKNRQLDGTLISSGLGVAAIRDLATSQAVRLLPIAPAVVAKIADAAYLPGTVPAGTYPGMTDAIPGVRVRNYLVTSSALSEELIYTLTKELYENLHHMVAASAAAKEIDIETASYPAPVPLHPGAIKYFHEKHLRDKNAAQ